MANQENKTAAAPYVSFLTFKNAMEQLANGIPNRIDRSVFTGMAWGVQSQLFAALKFLGLIDDHSKPTTMLKELCDGDEQNRKTVLDVLLRESYPALFALDLKKTTPGELSQRMGEAYNVNGETRDKATRFFLSAAEYSGIEMSPLFGSTKKINGTAPRTPRKKTGSRSKVIPYMTGEADKTGTSKTVKLSSGGNLTLSASLDLFALNPIDRKFVFELIDKLEAYEESGAQQEKKSGE